MRLFSFLTSSALLALPVHALAAGADATLKGLGQTGQAAGFGSSPLPYTTFIANGINAILGLAGIFFVCALVYAGIQYITSGGDQDKIKGAKGLISSSVIGIVIVASAFAITTFVIDQIAAGLNVETSETGQQIMQQRLESEAQERQRLEDDRNGTGL